MVIEIKFMLKTNPFCLCDVYFNRLDNRFLTTAETIPESFDKCNTKTVLDPTGLHPPPSSFCHLTEWPARNDEVRYNAHEEFEVWAKSGLKKSYLLSNFNEHQYLSDILKYGM